MALRYDFASDNVAGAMPEALQALFDANSGFAGGYGSDEISARAADAIRKLLDTDAEIRFAASGTAANALTLAALAQPHEAVICHEHAHIATDETGAPGFFGAGVGLIPLKGEAGRIDDDALAEALALPDVSYRQSPAALSLTNATEYGAVYSQVELASLIDAAKARGLKVHLDGARISNAVAAGFPITALGHLGIDVAVLGGTKAGSTPSEAIVLFDKSLARRFDARMKHAGQLVSKARFLAAPWIGMIESGAWLGRAGYANAMAQKLANLMPFPVIHPVEANGVFVEMDDEALERLRGEGWQVYRFIDGTVRFMCSWATTTEAVEALGASLKAISTRPAPAPTPVLAPFPEPASTEPAPEPAAELPPSQWGEAALEPLAPEPAQWGEAAPEPLPALPPIEPASFKPAPLEPAPAEAAPPEYGPPEPAPMEMTPAEPPAMDPWPVAPHEEPPPPPAPAPRQLFADPPAPEQSPGHRYNLPDNKPLS